MGIKSPSGRVIHGSRGREPPSLLSKRRSGAGAGVLPVLLFPIPHPCLVLARPCTTPCPLPGATETEHGVGRGQVQTCRWQVVTLELSVPEQSWALTPAASWCGRSLPKTLWKKKPDFCPMGQEWQMPFPSALVTLSPEDCAHWS